MLIEILKRTPPWVFVLFFVLLAYGFSQSRNRVVGRGMVPILPAAMIALSFYGVFSAFAGAAIGLVAWALGLAISVAAGARLMSGRGQPRLRPAQRPVPRASDDDLAGGRPDRFRRRLTGGCIGCLHDTPKAGLRAGLSITRA